MSVIDQLFRTLGKLALLLVFTAIALFFTGVILKPVFPAGLPAGPEQGLIYGSALAFALVIGHVGVTLAAERGDWSLAGLDASSWRPAGLLLGLVSGVAVIGVPAAILHATGSLGFVEAPPGPWGPAALTALLWLAGPALLEELVARGYAFGVLARTWGKVSAVVLTSVAFGLLHVANPGATVASIATVTLAGIYLASVRLATGSVVAAWLAHLAVNWVQGAVLHGPISGLDTLPAPDYRMVSAGPAWLTGGEWGLEAGAVTAAAMLVVTFLLLYLARSRPEPHRDHPYR